MKDPNKTKRRLLTASAGVVAFTAFEGLACGNPVAPSYEVPRDPPTAAPTDTATPTDTAVPSATSPATPPIQPVSSADAPRVAPESAIAKATTTREL